MNSDDLKTLFKIAAKIYTLTNGSEEVVYPLELLRLYNSICRQLFVNKKIVDETMLAWRSKEKPVSFDKTTQQWRIVGPTQTNEEPISRKVQTPKPEYLKRREMGKRPKGRPRHAFQPRSSLAPQRPMIP
jgi:hypothetical protein